MHYYYFNIADYRKDTQHLTPMEHYIYRELLDWEYLNEAPIPKDIDTIIRRLRLTNERSTDVQRVLNEFYTECEQGYTQERVEQEINTYRSKQRSASKAGKASGKARRSKARERSLNGRSNTLNQPITNNQEPITNILKGINADAWKEFEQHRKEMNQPLTNLARQKAMNVIVELSHEDQATVINNTIQNRWKGLFPGKLKSPTAQVYDWSKNL